MPTVVLRPASTTSQTGWVADPILTAADGNLTTGIAQNNVTCNWTAVLDDLDSGLSGATINNFTISLRGNAGRAGASTVTLSLVHSSDGEFAGEAESWTGSVSIETTSARTTQQDGSSALTFAYINNCSVKIAPNSQGITIEELYVTVDYTEASGYGHATLGVASANIASVKGVATANISKVIGV